MDELTPQPPPCALSAAIAIDIRNYVYHLPVSSAARHSLRAWTPPVTSAQVEHGREPAGRFIPTQRREERAQGKRDWGASHRETVAQPAQIAHAHGTVFAKPDVADDASLRVRYGLVRRHGGLLAGEARRPCLFAHRVHRAVGLR
ncbi:hypothetical protein PYCCODRAFT_1432071 [Trametes coccinea BRFM310]|uniref:Uncharacterized protein n=1 Tax=Trametes coccinea (strain BRFM310) TaxID=1353009 RepID=A0A1Y2J007_TRAC3|nr:hypothetical protein PYCCODRAFT_1432071 [Trametes coccinea BRFM310]